MSDSRWQRVEEIFHQAAELAPEARSVFLDQVCAGEASLRREIESLLAHDAEDGSTLANAVAEAAGGTVTTLEDLGGRTIGQYKVLGRLGEGGMGVVYKAKDTRLGRSVALKFIKAQFSRRGEREARAVAALNHPHICTLYEVGPNYLVMELIEGPTLAERIVPAGGRPGPIPLKETLEIARQIAEALEAAHEKGVVHRDLKPANIKLTAEGTVKVLDFGLAKAQAPAGGADDSPTLTFSATQAGTILGTAAYMSPEQASGKPVDRRADIWSFGVVLWELLTGHSLFEGETVSHTLAEVLGGPIDFDRLPRETPAAIRGLLRRCLDRDAKNRLRDIGEARIAIQAALTGETPLIESAPAPGVARRLWLARCVAAALAVGLAPFAFLYFRERPPALAAPVRFQFQPEDATLSGSPSLSPDGRKVAFVAGDRLWVHSFESGESRDLTAAENGVPFWSPDSRFIGYKSQEKLKKIEATGGPPQTVTDLHSNVWGYGAWNQEDVIVFGDRRSGLFRVPASSGVPVQITALDSVRHENSQFCPSFLPDGRHFVYIRASTDEGKSAIYLGSVDAKPEQQSSNPLVASNSQPVYAPSADPSTGYLLFVREGTLMAQPFDNRRMELKGQAGPVAEQVSDNIAGAIYVAFSASANDVLAFRRSVASQLTWYDREGKVMGTVGEPGPYGDLALSPDGTRLSVTKNRGGADAGDIWLLDFSRGGASTRFTFGSLVNTNSVWSPDGSRIIFSSNRDGRYNLYQKPANGVKDEEVLLKSSEDKRATSWSRDGRFLLYTAVNPKTKSDIWVLPLEGDRKPVPFRITEFNERQARFSPDGHWVAYASDESGQDEVYVRSFSMSSAGTVAEAGGKWQISNGLGVDPRWRGDGRELYYRSRGGRLLAVDIATTPAFRAGNPQPLGASTLVFETSFGLGWDSAADGRHFLTLATKRGPPPYTVVLNWQAGLKR